MNTPATWSNSAKRPLKAEVAKEAASDWLITCGGTAVASEMIRAFCIVAALSLTDSPNELRRRADHSYSRSGYRSTVQHVRAYPDTLSFPQKGYAVQARA
jgi:hypothetical protein